jgi:ATP dependent DNA ligase domain
MSPPEPMLSCSARRWPEGGEWVMQPKWDGFRLLIEVDDDRRVRAWSRHGTSLTARLGGLAAAFAEAPSGSVFDGELVVVSERGGRPVQDFAAVSGAVLRGDPRAADDLRFVGFDVLAHGGEDLRGRPWTERNSRLTDALPVSGPVRRVESLPASSAAHAAIVGLGFEGTVLKRPNSTYRPGRQRVWVKHKARYTADGVLLSVRQGRDGRWHESATWTAGAFRCLPARAGSIGPVRFSRWSTRAWTRTGICARGRRRALSSQRGAVNLHAAVVGVAEAARGRAGRCAACVVRHRDGDRRQGPGDLDGAGPVGAARRGGRRAVARRRRLARRRTGRAGEGGSV